MEVETNPTSIPHLGKPQAPDDLKTSAYTSQIVEEILETNSHIANGIGLEKEAIKESETTASAKETDSKKEEMKKQEEDKGCETETKEKEHKEDEVTETKGEGKCEESKSQVTEEEEDQMKELKKYNYNVPEGTSSHVKDKIDEHFDKYPWVLGALGRLFNLSTGYGPKFAPINIPLQRRLQTFAVLFWMSTFLFMGAGSFFFLMYLFFFTQYWWISLCYFTWYLGDRTICNRGGRRWHWMRSWTLWKHYRDFFPVHLIKTAELDPSKNYIMGYHPHGILSAGAFCHFATEGTDFSKVK